MPSWLLEAQAPLNKSSRKLFKATWNRKRRKIRNKKAARAIHKRDMWWRHETQPVSCVKQVVWKCGARFLSSATNKLELISPFVSGTTQNPYCTKKTAACFAPCKTEVVSKIPLSCAWFCIAQTGTFLNNSQRKHHEHVEATVRPGLCAHQYWRCQWSPDFR